MSIFTKLPDKNNESINLQSVLNRTNQSEETVFEEKKNSF